MRNRHRGDGRRELEVPDSGRPRAPRFRRLLSERAATLLLGTALVLATGGEVGAQADGGLGRITGRVIDESTGSPLALAQVYLPGTGIGALTDLDGRYDLRNVPAGGHELVVELLGFARKTVTGVQVARGEVTQVDVALPPEAIALEELTVTVAAERGNTVRLLSERKRAPMVVDAIGSDQIERSPDGDAASALKRVPGLTVVNDRYVYVRGLGERYGNATLNGAPLPSAEPDRKTVPLDIIPSRLLESVATAKTYLPNQPGDYAGGLVEIRTRRFPSYGMFKFSSTVGLNTESSLQSGLGYRGGDLDFFGFDDGTRNLPAGVPGERLLASNTTAEELERLGEGFAGPWGPTGRRHPPDQAYALAFGNEVMIGDRPLGFFGSVTHANRYHRRDGLIERVFASAGGADPELDYRGRGSTRSVGLGALFNASLGLGPTNRISVTSVYNRSVDDEARILQGFNLDSNTDQRNTRIRYVAQTLWNTQLSGEHRLGFFLGSKLGWRASYSRATRYEPNTREVLYREADGVFLFDTFVQSGSIFHQDLEEDGLAAGLDLEIPFQFRSLPAALTVGGSIDRRDRDALTRRFRFLPVPGALIGDSVRALPPNELFSPENIAPDSFQIHEATFPGDNYEAEQSVRAAFAMIDVEIVPRLRLVAGARVESAEQTVTPTGRFVTSEPPRGAKLDDTDVLPGMNLTYRLGPDMNLRLGLSRTLARPQLRELAPFGFADYAGSHLVIGNPTLERSRIQNYDLRWEWFPDAGSVLAVSAFYKRFDDPIESLVVPSTELIKSWVNAEGATNFGAELEIRSSLGTLARGLEGLQLNANLTLVESQVDVGGTATVFTGGVPLTLTLQDRDRPLQGQSPYVVNLGMTYTIPSFGARTTVLYNRFGRRIDSVGQLALPDIYEEARDQFDVVLEKELTRHFDLKFTASRLLGTEYVFTQGDDVLRRFDVGRSFSLSFAWQPAGQ